MSGQTKSAIADRLPQGASLITRNQDGTLAVPDRPAVGFIEGDGTGADIWRASRLVLDGAVAKAYGTARSIAWVELMVGEEAFEQTGEYLPEATFAEIEDLMVAIKGPLTTPVGGGIRSVNVALRQVLDLYACVRPVYHLPGVPSPVRHPERVNMVIFRENTEDVYAGIEWKKGSRDARRLLRFLNEEMLAGTDKRIRADSGVGVKPVSLRGTQRIVRMAIRHALNEGLPSVTLVHKGNIMKYTEGAFREWGYALADKEFGGQVRREGERAGGKRLIIKDRIADAMFQQVLLRPEEYSAICTLNLNGDYLSDACAAMVGGLGMAPGGNIGDGRALFEATHGSAPKYAGQDKVNPSSLILSGASMLEFLGWRKAGELVRKALTRTIERRTVTYDLERQLRAEGRKGVKLLSCSAFSEAICANMDG